MKKTALSLAAAFTLSAGIFASSGEAATHTVQSGDTLWNLSQEYNTSVNQIIVENDLTSSTIYPNQKLEFGEEMIVNTPAASGKTTYVVQVGDTLAKIAKAYSVSIDELVKWNNLASEHIIYADDTLAITEASAGMAKVTVSATNASKATTTNAATSTPKASTSQQADASTSSSVARTLTMEATAYTAFCSGCSGVTANGTDLHANPNARVIAVDPSVIPLGTKVWVEGYGEAIAADTGGAIKGNRIDVYVQTNDQAYAWGRKSVTVKVLD